LSRVCLSLFRCHGHPNVQLSHPTTLELERSGRLTPRGDCIACVDCRGDAGCASRRGLAALYVAALGLPAGYAGFRVYGVSPGVELGDRLVVRKSLHTRDSLIVAASLAAADVGDSVRRLLASSFTRCLALHVVFEIDVDPEDVLAGRVVKNPTDSGDSAS